MVSFGIHAGLQTLLQGIECCSQIVVEFVPRLGQGLLESVQTLVGVSRDLLLQNASHRIVKRVEVG